MADAFYNKKRDITAYKLLTKRGFPMVCYFESGEVFDPDTGVKTAGTVVEVSFVGIMRFFSADEINNTTSKAGDCQVLASGKEFNDAGVTPDTTMRIVSKGVTYFVVRITPTTPGGVDVLYRLQVRR